MQDRELAYVQASRARGETRIYIDRLEAGHTLAALSQRMNVSHQKELASSLLGQQEAYQLAHEL